jgi:hypothetical protein
LIWKSARRKMANVKNEARMRFAISLFSFVKERF